MQVVTLLLEKGQLPAVKVHAPVTPQCTPPNQAETSKQQEQKASVPPEYSFITNGKLYVHFENAKKLLLQYATCIFAKCFLLFIAICVPIWESHILFSGISNSKCYSCHYNRRWQEILQFTAI